MNDILNLPKMCKEEPEWWVVYMCDESSNITNIAKNAPEIDANEKDANNF